MSLLENVSIERYESSILKIFKFDWELHEIPIICENGIYLNKNKIHNIDFDPQAIVVYEKDIVWILELNPKSYYLFVGESKIHYFKNGLLRSENKTLKL